MCMHSVKLRDNVSIDNNLLQHQIHSSESEAMIAEINISLINFIKCKKNIHKTSCHCIRCTIRYLHGKLITKSIFKRHHMKLIRRRLILKSSHSMGLYNLHKRRLNVISFDKYYVV